MHATLERATKEAAPVTHPALAAQVDPLANLMRDCGTPDAPETEQDAPPVCRSLADLAPPLPEKDNPAALFRNGWLRKGGGAFLVSTSGTGKSVWTVQASLLWAQGLPAFGIEPVRPLKIGIVQAEDDDEEMLHFRNDITDGLVEQAGLDRDQVEAAARSGVYLFNPVGKVGGAFIEYLGKILEKYPELDLLIINPLQSYFGGDISRNAEVSGFLRAWLDPLIKPNKVGVLFVHHTNKPPNAKERSGWGTDAFAAYIGAGGAEIVNWARAMLALMPCENAPGIFRLTAVKRGERLGWKDAEGKRSYCRFIAHSANRIFWRDATPEEMGAAQTVERAKCAPPDPKADAERIAEKLRERAQPLTDARSLAEQLFHRTRGRKAFDLLKETPGAFQLSVAIAKYKSCAFIGTKGQAEAAAKDYDANVCKQPATRIEA